MYMKKLSNTLLKAIAVGLVALVWTSCVSDMDSDGTYRLHSMSDNYGNEYVFSYDAQGRVASVVSPDDNRVFNYEGNKLTIMNGDAVEYEMTLNADGFATEVKNAEHTWTITYDKNGYMVEGKKDGVKCTGQSIEDGNILYWERYDSEHDFWRRKEATYLDKINFGNIQTHYAEDLGFSRWAWEAHLFGNTSVNVLESSVWINSGEQKSSYAAVYKYKYNSSGFITSEIKYYGEWNGTDLSGMHQDAETTFTWEIIK